METDDTLGAANSGEELFRQLPQKAEVRRREIAQLLSPALELIASYGEIVARAVWAMGKIPPTSRQDVVVRDLIADVFDFLTEWPRPLLEGRLQVAFPLSRRAYESLSLLSACAQDAKLAAKWDGGANIKNKDIRKALATAQFPESESTLRELYADFSNGAHPNRVLVAERHLGSGNAFTLGSIGVPPLVGIVDQFIHVIEMWFWFGAVAALVARYAFPSVDPTFGADYLAVASKVGEVKEWLVESFNRLLEESDADPDSTTSSPPAV